MLDVTYETMCEVMEEKNGRAETRTTDFLLTIAGDGTEDGVLLAG
jgi:hypothetical protein